MFSDALGMFGFIVNFLVGTLLGLAVTAFYLKAHDNPDTVEVSDLWNPELLNKYASYLGAACLSGLVIILGFILLIVPGMILSLIFFFTSYAVVDKNLGPVEAMKESARITKGYRWSLFGLCILLGLVMILGLLCFLVGILVAMPVVALAIVHAYRELEKRTMLVPVPAV